MTYMCVPNSHGCTVHSAVLPGRGPTVTIQRWSIDTTACRETRWAHVDSEDQADRIATKLHNASWSQMMRWWESMPSA